MIRLGDENISVILMGQSPPSHTYNEIEKGLPFLQGNAEFGKTYPSICKYCTHPIKIAEKNDVLLSVRAPVGDVNLALSKCCIGRELAAIRPKKHKLNYLYLFYFLKNNKSSFESVSTGSTFKAIKKDDIEKFNIPLPPLSEQKKIADVLSTVDRAIEKVDEAIEKTQKLKIGLMQQLLTRGIGHNEFRETEIGRIPKEWDVDYLGNLAILDRGKFAHRPRNDPRFYGGKYPFIQTGDISEANGIIKKYSQTLNEEGIKISRLFKKGTLVITIAGNIGILNFNSYFPDSIVGISPIKAKINSSFLLYMMTKLKSEISSMAPRSTQKNINLEILKKIKLPLPPLFEQKKIADILSVLDKKFELLTNRKTKLERVKKGLMNDLLTGRKRVKLDS